MAQFLYTVPLQWLSSLILILAPRADRAALGFILNESGRPWPLSYLEAAGRIPRAILTASVKSFNPKVLAGDLMCVFIGFGAAPFAERGWILAFAALASLLWDGHTYPAKPSAKQAAGDGFVIGLVLFLTCLGSLPPKMLVSSVYPTMIMIAATRFSFRIHQPDRGPIEESYLSAKQLTILWIIGWAALGAGYKVMFLKEDWLRDHLLGGLVIPLAPAIRLQSDAIAGVWFRKLKMIVSLLDPRKQEKHELEEMENTLPVPILSRSTRLLLSRFLFRLFFIGAALPIVLTVAGVVRGTMSVEEIKWVQFAVNAAVYVVLATMWREIKKINRQVGFELRRGIQGS